MSAIELHDITPAQQPASGVLYDPHVRFFQRANGRRAVGINIDAIARTALNNPDSVKKITIPAVVWSANGATQPYPVLWEYGGGKPEGPDAELSSQCQIVGTTRGGPALAREVRRVYYPFAPKIANARQALCSIIPDTVFAIGYSHRHTKCYLVYRVRSVHPFPLIPQYQPKTDGDLAAVNADLIAITTDRWNGVQGWIDEAVEAQGVDIRGMLDRVEAKLATPQLMPSHIQMAWIPHNSRMRAQVGRPTTAEGDITTVAPDAFVHAVREAASAYRHDAFAAFGRTNVRIYLPTTLVMETTRGAEPGTLEITCHICRRLLPANDGAGADIAVRTVVKDRLPAGMPGTLPLATGMKDLDTVMAELERTGKSRMIAHLLCYW